MTVDIHQNGNIHMYATQTASYEDVCLAALMLFYFLSFLSHKTIFRTSFMVEACNIRNFYVAAAPEFSHVWKTHKTSVHENCIKIIFTKTKNEWKLNTHILVISLASIFTDLSVLSSSSK